MGYKNMFSTVDDGDTWGNNRGGNDRSKSKDQNASYIQDRGHEILASDIQSIVGKGEKTILIRGHDQGNEGLQSESIDSSDLEEDGNYLHEEEAMIANSSRQRKKRQRSKGKNNYFETFSNFFGSSQNDDNPAIRMESKEKKRQKKDKKLERDIILEIESKVDGKHRDEWLLALNEVLLQNFDADSLINEPKSLKEQADKEIYFQKRQMEIADRKKESQARKEQYMKESGGLKYTALAMANRA